jgi:hypothetical protein
MNQLAGRAVKRTKCSECVACLEEDCCYDWEEGGAIGSYNKQSSHTHSSLSKHTENTPETEQTK